MGTCERDPNPTRYGMHIGVQEGAQGVFNAEARRSVTIYHLPLDTLLYGQMLAKNGRHHRPWSKSVTRVSSRRCGAGTIRCGKVARLLGRACRGVRPERRTLWVGADSFRHAITSEIRTANT